MRPLRIAVPATSVLLTAALATGCGGNGSADAAKAAASSLAPSAPASPSVDPQKALAGALSEVVERTKAATSLHATMTQEADGTQFTKADISMRLDGGVAMRMSMSMDTTAISDPGDTPEKMRMDMIVTPDAMYVKSDSAPLPKGKTWVKMPMDQDTLSQMMRGGRQQDPKAQLNLLLKSDGIRLVGTETVAGAPAKHYAGTLDLRALAKLNADQLGMSESDFEGLSDEAGTEGLGSTDMDVWVDERGLPVKQTMTLHITDGGTQHLLTTTMNYQDWDGPVDVTPPPAALTVDASRSPACPP